MHWQGFQLCQSEPFLSRFGTEAIPVAEEGEQHNNKQKDNYDYDRYVSILQALVFFGRESGRVSSGSDGWKCRGRLGGAALS